MNRRTFLASMAASGAAMTTGALADDSAKAEQLKRFNLKYAPHFGMFKHHAGQDLVDQVHFMADQGFTALEDNGMKGRTPALQGQIAAAMAERGMKMGVFVAYGNFKDASFARRDEDVWKGVLAEMEKSVEVAKRVRARWVTVVPGRYHDGLEWDYQTANVIELLKRCAEICEPSGLAMVLEPLNHWTNHPGVFLTKIPQAYMICRSVGSPSCKILFDIYHQQISEGNLIPNLDRAWEEVAYVQIGDNPGRKEPTTGEINYLNVFRHLHQKGYQGLLGMEHGNSKKGLEGEQAVIDAYRACDAFI